MTIKEKAERYDEAINAIKELKEKHPTAHVIKDWIKENFPELEESEDEKIRKNLITCISTLKHPLFSERERKEFISWLEKQTTPQVRTGLEWENTIDDACDARYTEEYSHDEYCHEQSFKWGFKEGVDWLEKQGEHKVEPKFHEGDIIRHKKQGFTCKIIGVDTEYRLSECNGTHLPFDSQDDYELVEPKPAWSEEDENKANNLCVFLDQMVSFIMLGNKDATEFKDWLKSLKYRVQSQRSIWTKGDDVRFTSTMQVLEYAKSTPDYNQYAKGHIRNNITWLKSIKDRVQPQTQWKPSDEQMEAFEHFVRSIGESGYASPYDNNTKLLYSLYEQLKKLREE